MVSRRTKPATPISLRALPPIARAVLAFAAMMQLGVLCGTPWTEVRASSALGSHIEKPGELHQIHDEDNCASCVMRHLMGNVQRVASATPSAVAAHEPPPRATTMWVPSERVAPDAARAPPLAG